VVEAQGEEGVERGFVDAVVPGGRKGPLGVAGSGDEVVRVAPRGRGWFGGCGEGVNCCAEGDRDAGDCAISFSISRLKRTEPKTERAA
jgi:hypothetical protein